MGHVVGLLWICLVALPGAAPTMAAPWRPDDDAAVLEHTVDSPGSKAIRLLAQESAQRPRDLDLALRLSRGYIELGRAQSDPRYYGYAEAALAPWWTAADPPAAVLALRATIRQHNHDFDAALDDLSRVLQADPTDAHAWWTRAIILQVQGRYDEAKASCSHVLQLASPLIAASCLASVDSLSGAAESSYTLLRNVLTKSPDQPARLRAWACTTLAEIAARLGKEADADRHFRDGLALTPDDSYLLGAYADFLLDQDRADSVRTLLRDRFAADALLLRLAIAASRLGSADAAALSDLLAERFAAARGRGDNAHRREEARFSLALLRQPEIALALARDNWDAQREPADARVLLEAAYARNNVAAAQPVLEFLARNRTEDVVLRKLARSIEALPR